MTKTIEIDRTINNINDYLEYQLQELEISELSELYPTIEERINFVENCEMHFNSNYKPQIERGINLYF